jgi:Na+/proline symporter
MRWALVGVAVVTGGMALMRNNIYELVGESSALSLVSLFAPLIAGLYWRRATGIGAIASMIGGMAVWLLTLMWLPGLAESGTLSGTAQVLAEVPPMLYGFGASILGMVLGSLLTKPESREVIGH